MNPTQRRIFRDLQKKTLDAHKSVSSREKRINKQNQTDVDAGEMMLFSLAISYLLGIKDGLAALQDYVNHEDVPATQPKRMKRHGKRKTT